MALQSEGKYVSPVRPIITRRFKKMPFGPFYLFGALASNSSGSSSWDLVKQFAMLNSTRFNGTRFDCCLMYIYDNTHHIHQVVPLHTRRHWAEADLLAYHFTCPNVLHYMKETLALSGMIIAEEPCINSTDYYVETFRSQRQLDITLAIGTQVAFGNISVELIIEWMETYKYLGADKVISYYYEDINENALKVLKFYHNTGFLDSYHYIPAAEGNKLTKRLIRTAK